MMIKLMAAITGNAVWMTTAYLNKLHSTDRNGLLTNFFSYYTYPCRRENAALRYFCA